MSVAPIRKLLDQLMGPDRNKLPANRKIKRHWSDKDVCRYHLAAFCPNELFEGTKADIGVCNQRHADVLRDQYQQSDQYGLLGHEEELLSYIERLLYDCDRKIEKARARLENNKEKNKDARERAEVERHAFLSAKIEHMLAKVEALGNQGNVVEAKEVSEVIEKLRQEKSAPADASYLARSDMAMEREMDVCEVCGALILVGDTHLRIEDHISGRQHAGYARLREQAALMQDPFWRKDRPPGPAILEEPKVVEKEKRSPRRRSVSSSSNGRRSSRRRSRRDTPEKRYHRSRVDERDMEKSHRRERRKPRERSRERSFDRNRENKFSKSSKRSHYD